MKKSGIRVNIPISSGLGVSAPLEDVVGGAGSFLYFIVAAVVIAVLAVVAMYLAIPAVIVAIAFLVLKRVTLTRDVQNALAETQNAMNVANEARQKAFDAEEAAKRNPDHVPQLLTVTANSLQEARAASSLAHDKANFAATRSKKSLNRAVQANVAQAEIHAKQATELTKETLKHNRALQVMVAHASLKGALENGAGAALTKLKSVVGGKEQEKSKFADALMAMCALVACVDNVISGNEKAEIRRIIASDEVLRSLESTKLLEIFDSHCSDILADDVWGNIEAKKAIGVFKGRQEEANVIVQVGILVGQSDDHFSVRGTAVVKEMCEMLGLNPQVVGI